MKLLGRVLDIREGRLFLADDLERNLAAGDRTYDEFTAAVDRHIAECGLGLPDEPFSDVRSAPARHPKVLDLRAERITSVIWATGYVFDFAWVHLPIFDDRGLPVQRRGATAAAGVYFLGLAWMHKVKSSFLYGVGEDARRIAEFVNGRGESAKGAA
jgi:putative flavoprotein involved in K+ transport